MNPSNMSSANQSLAAAQPPAKVVLTVVGAGNGGHVLCGLAGSLPHVEVRLLTRRPDLFRDHTIEVERPGACCQGDA